MGASYRDLRVWQLAMDLAVEVYKQTCDFPKTEIYGLTSQMRRAAVSIPSTSRRAKGVQLIEIGPTFSFTPEVAKRLAYLDPAQSQQLLEASMHLGRMLNALIQSLKAPEVVGDTAA